MDVIIKIEALNGYYHAQDAVVKQGDVLKITNEVPNISFTVTIGNKDNLLSGGSLLNPTVAPSTTVTIGTVAGTTYLEKEYGIYPTSASVVPGIDAPPRIIRVA